MAWSRGDFKTALLPYHLLAPTPAHSTRKAPPKVLWTSSGTGLAIRRCRSYSKEGLSWIGMILNKRPSVTLALTSWQSLPSS
jgi:hypothetical protein